MAGFTMSTIDRLNKPTSMTIAVDDAETNVNLQALIDATDAVILGADIQGAKAVYTSVDVGSAVPPNNELADRGNKWLLRLQDSVTGKIYQHEIGTADNSQLPSATTDFLDLTAGVGLALKTAIETVYVSPAGNAATLVSVQQVNRSIS